MTAAIVAVVSSLAEVRDVTVDDGVAWVATSGGLVAYDQRGHVLATSREEQLRGVSSVDVTDGTVTVETPRSTWSWEDRWVRSRRPELRWRGQQVVATADGVLHVGDTTVDLPGPAADLAVVGDELRVACVLAAFVWDGSPHVLPIPATAAGPVWGTADGALLDDTGRRVGAVPAAVTSLAAFGDGWIVGTRNGTYQVGSDTRRLDVPDLCGNFVTGLTRWKGNLVAATFDGGACVRTESGWAPIEGLPSTMVNDVLAVGDVLWLATAEGLVRIEGDDVTVFHEVADEAPRGSPGLNHNGVNALATDGKAFWAVDVLGPVRVGATWSRHRWSVTGHSYQNLAVCPGGDVWAGSEDDGLAVTGLKIGHPNGRSRWSQVGMFDGLPEDWVMAVACAGRGAAWVGTYRNGVGRVDATGWHAVSGLEGAWVQALAVAGDTLWVGTADGLWSVYNGIPTKVADEDVWTLLVEGDTVWAGTRSGIVELRVSEVIHVSMYQHQNRQRRRCAL